MPTHVGRTLEYIHFFLSYVSKWFEHCSQHVLVDVKMQRADVDAFECGRLSETGRRFRSSRTRK